MISRADKCRASDLACWHQPAGSHRLVSLWDMLCVHANDFVLLMKHLERIKWGLKDLIPRVASSNSSTQDEVRKIFNDSVSVLVSVIGPICKRLELDSASAMIVRMQQTKYECDGLLAAIEQLTDRVEDQLASRIFWFVEPSRVKYFGDEPAFGLRVLDAFPEMTADLKDAHVCLGAGCWTAAVYHLMRVMEYALVQLTKKLAITIKDIEYKTWGELLSQINAAVAVLPNKTPAQQSFSAAAIHLRQVKNAWRDPTMHNRRHYDQTEAEAIFDNVKTFVVELTTI